MQKVSLQILVCVLSLNVTSYVHAQLLVGDAGGGNSYINEYTLSGQPLATPLIRPGYAANDLEGIAVYGNNVFTADRYSGNIGEYSLSGQVSDPTYILLPSAGSFGVVVADNMLYASNGGTIYAFNISGATPVAVWNDYVGASGGLALSGGNVFAVLNENAIGEYNALTGTSISSNLVTGLSDVFGLTANGNDLYVSSYAGGTVGEYTTTGQTVNATLVQGIPDGANGLAVAENMLYVADISQVMVYNATSGSFIEAIKDDLEQANSVAIIPEPSVGTLLAIAMAGLGLFLVVRWKRPSV